MGVDDFLKAFDWSQLAIFTAFALPGFISLQVWGLISPANERTFLDRLPEAIAFGVLNAAIAGPLVLFISPHSLAIWYATLLVGLLVLPVCWPFLLQKLLEILFGLNVILNPVHNGWDAAFLKREPYFVIVHLKDGRRVGGYYGYQSYAGVFPASGHLYLEALWALDPVTGKFLSPINGSKGIILRPEDYQFVELLRG